MEVSKELKVQILNLYDNYNNRYLNSITVNEKKIIYSELEKISKIVNFYKKHKIICPETGKVLKILNLDNSDYLSVKTNALCFECLKVKYYSCFDNLISESWPVSYVGSGLICKECTNKE